VRKVIAAFLVALLLTASLVLADDASQYKTRFIRTTSDTSIDSLAVGRRQHIVISNVWAWYDNAANTNNFNVEIVEGMSQMAVQGTAGRIFKWSEAMTSSGIKSLAIPMFQNIVSTQDSTVYLSISATGSDTLLVAYTYKVVN
jgi:hypothetical protein